MIFLLSSVCFGDIPGVRSNLCMHRAPTEVCDEDVARFDAAIARRSWARRWPGPVMCSDEEAEQLELDPVSVCGRDDGQSE